MTALDHLNILDLSDQIARLPKQRSFFTLPARSTEQFITEHYSAVIYRDRSRSAELQRIFDEAAYQLRTNYNKRGGAPAYPDGLLYDFVVLSDGQIVRTRDRSVQLWHVANALGNRRSWSTHVMLGGDQELTPAQRGSMFLLWDALRADGNIPRQNVVAHCEWPVGDGQPVRTSSYRPQPGQSLCPGKVLIQHVYAYRTMEDAANPHPDDRRFVVIDGIDYAAIRTDRTTDADEAGQLQPGETFLCDDVTNGWAHLSPRDTRRDLGFVHMSLLKGVPV